MDEAGSKLAHMYSLEEEGREMEPVNQSSEEEKGLVADELASTQFNPLLLYAGFSSPM